ncbi:uncharacterized protein LOC117172991 [Belonocnema kinseyi]|uniref:uncharacterized protein LOC117172991 n=1 Tax=Belonocnema kinseyi TaxID=2817044 RepID=UPI00143D590A|nr:uncharacterized protein LOC117172991 [Belonocnema kinseyi]
MRLVSVRTSGYFAVISITAFLIISFSVETWAKRGCSAFGHSCFGGHGKRSETKQQESSKERNSISREVPEYVLSRSNDEIFAMDPAQLIQNRAERRISEIDKKQLGDDPLSIFIRQWIISRHRQYADTGDANK